MVKIYVKNKQKQFSLIKDIKCYKTESVDNILN